MRLLILAPLFTCNQTCATVKATDQEAYQFLGEVWFWCLVTGRHLMGNQLV
jgi:hypothetical protein